MNIQPDRYNNNITLGKAPKKFNPNSLPNRIKQSIMDALPSNTFKDGEKVLSNWRNFDERMSKPAENRGVMGGTAILLQPAIDASNKRVDNETRRVSICRTLAKIIAGTTVGILVRGSAYKMVESMTNPEGKSAHSKTLLPKKYIEELIKNPKLMKNYRSALSTGLAICAMCITNFVLDAPLTVFLTNKFTSMTGAGVNNGVNNGEQKDKNSAENVEEVKVTPNFKIEKFKIEEAQYEERA